MYQPFILKVRIKIIIKSTRKTAMRFNLSVLLNNLSWLFLLLIATGCSISPDTIEAPDWTPALFGPVAQATVEMEDIEEISKLTYKESISVMDLGFQPFGRLTPVSLGPFDVTMYDGLIDMKVGLFKIEYELVSDMPIDIEPGAIIRIATRNEDRTVMEVVLESGLPAFTAFSESTEFTDLFIEQDLVMWLDNIELALDGTIPLDDSQGFEAIGTIALRNIGETHLEGDHTISISDTTEFSLETDGIDDLDLTGKLILQLENEFPIGGVMDITFLSANGTVLERLTDNPINMEVPNLSNEGLITSPSIQNIEILIDPSRSENLGNAEWLAFTIDLFTPSVPSVESNQSSHLDLKVIADIQLIIKP
ncbi:MAG: hypothetical protein ACI959_000025 [Limisphaerales bacterium]|jgi:hypothetical protein